MNRKIINRNKYKFSDTEVTEMTLKRENKWKITKFIRLYLTSPTKFDRSVPVILFICQGTCCDEHLQRLADVSDGKHLLLFALKTS